jgi:hypothetical protein
VESGCAKEERLRRKLLNLQVRILSPKVREAMAEPVGLTPDSQGGGMHKIRELYSLLMITLPWRF